MKDLYKIGEGEYEADFAWQLPEGFSGNTLTIGTEINDTEHVIPSGAWPYIEYSEVKLDDNYKSVQVPVIQENLAVKNLAFSENPAQPGDSVTISADVENDCPKSITTPVQGFFNGSKASEQQMTIPAGGTVKFSFDITAPDPGDYEASVTVNPNHDSPPDESNWNDNAVSGTLHVEDAVAPSPAGDGTLTFQAISQKGSIDLMTGKVMNRINRSPNTAKWTDDVTATLTTPEPPKPDGIIKLENKGMIRNYKLTEWHVNKATLTYPKKNPDFIFVNPLPPIGNQTVNMTPQGHNATVTFREDWAMDGAKIYMIQQKLLAANPKPYTITADYTVDFTYSYEIWVPGEPGPPPIPGYWDKVTVTDSYQGSASGALKVDGTGVNSLAE